MYYKYNKNMIKNNILKDVNRYIKVFNTKFYNNIKDKLNIYPETINEINDDPYLLEAIRIHMCYNINNWKICLTNEILKEKYINRKIRLNEIQYNNMMNQIKAILNNSIYKICDNEYSNYQNDKEYWFVFLEKDKPKENEKNKYIIECDNIYGIINIALGIEIFTFLNFQRLDRLCKIINNTSDDKMLVNKYSTKNIEMIDKHYKLIKRLRFTLADKMMIFSGLMRIILGTIYTEDIDLLVLFDMHNMSDIDKVFEYFRSKYYELTILSKDGNWYRKNEGKYDPNTIKIYDKYFSFDYQRQFLTYEYPNLFGADDIFEIFSNPKFHFHFMGIKFLCIEGFIKRLINRSRASSYVDLLALEKINGIDIKGMCLPYLAIAQGKYTIYDKDEINNLTKKITKYYSEWYDERINIDEIKKKIPLCVNTTFDVYSGKNIKDPEVGPLKYFHNRTKLYYLEKYVKNKDVLIDVGSGKLLDLRFWKEINIKKVYAIEPSKSSITKAQEILKEHKGNPEVILINSIGDSDWDNMNINENADCITFMFTIHYMINNLKTIIDNIKKYTNQNAIIIIFLLDGNKIHNYFRKNQKKDIIVRGKQEPLFIVHPFYKVDQTQKITNNEDILVYLKGTYGVNKGSLEKVVNIDILIDEFNKNEFELLEKKYLSETNIKEKKFMRYNLLKISEYYMALIFRKK